MADVDTAISARDLERLCAALAGMAGHAYLKDGQLRYRVASPAHLDAVGIALEDAQAQAEPVHEDDEDSRSRDQAERRCLVFGKRQRIGIAAQDGSRRVLLMRRIRCSDDGATYILAHESVVDFADLLPRQPPQPYTADVSDADLQSIIEAMPMGVVVTDSELTVQLVNGPFFDIWKVVRREDLVGRNFRALIDVNRHNNIYDVADEDWEDYVGERLAEIAEGRVEPREFARLDGVTLIYSVTPLSGGRRMICYYDVTEMRAHRNQVDLANRQLERTVRLLDDAAEAMAQGLLIYDETNIVFANKRFYEFLDVPEERIAPGRPWWNLIEYCAARGDYGSPKETREALAYIRESASNRRYHQMERLGRDGRWLRIDGKPTAAGLMVVTYSDISEIKSRESELKSLVSKAEASDRAKSEFLANMSHEIRTPMNGVLGMAELLSKTELDTRQRTYCDIIVKSGNALLTIINDILDFSKIGAGAITLERQPFDLREAVEDVVGLMAKNAAERDIELAVDVQHDLVCDVIGDPGRFRQVVTNLVGNAVKFTEKGHVLVSVSGEVRDGRTSFTLKVEDTGLGIPREKLATIFDKFSQVDGSSTRRHEGTGLGLAITAKLVELMGGEITVESEEGVGSVFSLSLSLPACHARVTPPPLARDIAGARILVVDDNAVNRDILTAQLGARGCDVCAAVDAEEGLSVLGAAARMGVTVDCVILDHHMPGTTGLEMAERIRRMPEGTDLPLVLLTSVDVDPNMASIARLDLSAWLTKPARESLLIETLGRTLSAAGDSRQPPKDTGAVASQAESLPDHDATAAAPAPRSGPAARKEMPLALWMDEDGLAESVAGIAAALSDEGEENGAHLDRQMGERAQSAGRSLPTNGRSQRSLDILVAEDNEVNQIVFSQILDDLDVVYRIVGNGALAVEACKRDVPRLVLMDVSMPVMNGHEAARAIRAAEVGTGYRVPIVGITAHALKGDREACMEAGMDDYMIKPISPEALEEKIRQWIDLEALHAGSG